MILLDLAQNLALLVAMAAAYRIMSGRWREESAVRRMATGVLFGVVALVGMMTPVRLMPGLIFDGRSIILGVAGFVGGPVVALVAASMTAAYRISVGGVGTFMGVAVVVEASALGVAFHVWRRRTGVMPGTLALWLFGLAIHGVMAMLLLTLPTSARQTAWGELGLAIIMLYPVVTVLVCRVFLDYERLDDDRRALEESEARYRTLWAGIGEAVVAADLEGRVTVLNSVAESLTRWTSEDAVGAPIERVLRLTDETTGGALTPRLLGADGEDGGREFGTSAVLTARDGLPRPVAGHASPILDDAGDTAGTVVIFRDQSVERAGRRALQESRERMELALRGAELGTWDWDVRTGATVFNERWAEMLGYTLDEIVPDVSSWQRLLHPDDAPETMERLNAHLEGRTDQYESEHRTRHKSGGWVWVLDRGRVIERDEQGAPLRAAGTHLDITERKEVAEALRAREVRLVRQNQVLLRLMSSGELFGAELRRAVERITEAGAQLADTGRVSLWWFGSADEQLTCADVYERATGQHSEGGVLSSSDISAYIESHRQGRVLVASDVLSDPRTKGIPRDYWVRNDIHSTVDAPVWIGNRVAGVLCFEHVGRARMWTPEDERLAVTMAALVSLCVESTGRAKAEQTARDQLAAMEKMDSELRRSLEEAERARRALLGTLEDRKLAELALRESEGFIRAVMDHLPIGVAVNGVEPTAFTYMNDNFHRIYRTTREVLEDPDAFWEAVYEDPAFREQMRARVVDDIISGDPERMHWEDVPISRGGVTTFISARNTPVPGKPLMISTVWDVTDRKHTETALRESEARFRRLAENAPDLIFRYRFLPEEDRGFEYVSPAATALTGYTPDEHYADPELRTKMVHPGDRDRLVVPEAPGPADPVVLRWIRKDRGVVWVEVRNAIIQDERGRVVAVEGIARDVTERERHEREIRNLADSLDLKVQERTRQLQAANAELESFSYSVSHDLKAPLRAIDGYSALLQETGAAGLDEEGVRLLEEIRTNARQMGILIEDLLAFSRVGRASLAQEAVALKPIIVDLVERERRVAPGRRIELEVEDIPLVRGDVALLRQALDNIVGNAVKFTRPRAVARIEVTVQRGEASVEVAVRDNGVGFDPQYRHKLFRVFERLHYQDEFEGTGVGLAIVKRIVDRHRGSVTAESDLGAGTVVRLTLPLAPEA